MNLSLSIKKLASVLLCFVLLFSLCIVSGVSAVAADNEIAATDGNLRYLGHWVKSGNNMKCYFQSTVEVKFTGTSLKVKIQASNIKGVMYRVDGGEWKYLTTNGTVTLAQGLKAGNHKVVLMSSVNKTGATISGFIIDDGAKLLAPDTNKVMAFIGDSITMGHYEGKLTDSFEKTYAMLTAEHFGYSVTSTAVGGIGISCANSDAIDTLGMVERYFKLGAYGSDAANVDFDTSIYTPDYVVIALGTNSNLEKVSGLQQQQDYEKFLEKLRKVYPKARIYCLSPFATRVLDSYIMEAVNSRRASGDKNVFYSDAYKSNYTKVQGGSHPSYEGQNELFQIVSMSILATDKKANSAGSNSSTKTYSKYSRVQRTSSEQATDKTESVVEDTTSKKGNTSKKNNTNSKVTSADKDTTANENITEDTEIIETIGENTESEQGGIMDYLWILIVVAAVVVIALLVVIFLPQIKALFKK